MSLIDYVLGGDSSDPEQQLINKALGSYYRTRFVENAGEQVLGRVFGGGRNLQDEDTKLSIAMKKRALGLPLDDDDYETASNDELPFKTSSVTLAGRKVEQLIPEPGFLRESARVPRTLSAIFGTALKAVPKGKAYNVASSILRTARRA